MSASCITAYSGQGSLRLTDADLVSSGPLRLPRQCVNDGAPQDAVKQAGPMIASSSVFAIVPPCRVHSASICFGAGCLHHHWLGSALGAKPLGR